MTGRGIVSIAAIVIAAGCTTGIALTDRGAEVTRIADADIAPGCRLLGDVAIGIPPDAGRPRTEEQLEMLMRNKAGEVGATHVVVEQSEDRGEHWVGRGRAYRCPETPPPTVSAATAGGEDEAAGAGDAEGEGDAEEAPLDE